MSASAPSGGDAASAVLIKASMPREHGSGFITIKIDSDATTIGGLKRQLLEKVRTKRVSISLAPGQALESPSAPPPALTQAALDEYGITLFDEAAAAAEAAATASPKASSSSGNGAPAAAAPAFLSDDRPLRDLRRTFAGCTIWKLSLVAKPKKDIGVTEGYLKKRSSSKRLFGAWQKRFFRLTTRQLAYWTTEAAAQMVPVGGGGLGAEMRSAEPPKGAFRVSAFHEAVTVAKSATGPSSPPSVPSLPATQPPPPPQQPPIPGRAPLAPRGRVARQASVLNVNLDSTRVRLGPWGSFIFILEFPLRSLELQASNKADFQRWLNALFGSAWVSNLVVQHAADEGKAPQPSLPLGAAPASAGSGPAYGSLRTHQQQQQQNGSSYPAAASPASLHGSIPIESRIGFDPSRIGGGGTDEPVYDNHARAGRGKDDDGEDSREVSLSARDLLRRAVGVSAFGFGSATGPSTGAGAGAGVAPPNDDDEGYDSQDSMSRMSQAWEDTQDEWALDAIAAGAGAGAGRGQHLDALGGLGGGYEEFDPRPSGGGGEDRLNSFMPSASATPESSQARPVISDSDDDDDDDHGRKPGQQQHARGGGGGGGIPVEEDSDHGLDLSSASGSDSDSDSDDEMRGVQLRAPPPPPMPAALAAASSAAAPAAVASGAPPLPLSPYPGAASPAAAASPASPSGLFAGGLGAGASGGGVAFHGALLGGAHGRRESFSGGLGLAGGVGAGAVGAVGSSASRRPSVDLSASIASLMGPPPPPPMPSPATAPTASPSGSGSGSTAAPASVQPPPGSELNLSPTLRRMSLGGGGQQPPLPAGPPPSSSPSSSDAAEAEARLKRQADVRAALAAVEAEEKASEAAAEERAAEERRKKEEAQAANLRNIRAYLEAEQAAEAAAKAKAAATASAAPAPPPFPGSLSTPSPAPSPPLPPSSGPADIEQEVAQLRSTLALRSHADVVEVAAAQAREIAGLKAQIAAMKMMQ